MAEICEWKSDTQFDENLRKIEHYQIHPEMLPFIGSKYREYGILLVGESHYIENINDVKEDCKEYYRSDWYKKELPNEFPNKSWFTTRQVIHNFLVLRRSKAHSMFGNPAKESKNTWKEANITDSDAFNTCAFMNYYQRPASEFGKTIDDDIIDKEKASHTLNAVIKTIRPKAVIFLSAKAFKSYDIKTAVNDIIIDYVFHPTSPHWYDSEGKEKYIKILSQFVAPHFENIPQYSIETIKQKINCEYKIVSRKSFNSDYVTVQTYGNNDTAKEIVWRKIINGKKVGMGYRFDYRFIWLWDYDNEKYLNNDELLENNLLKEMYNDFVDYIISL